MSRLFHIFLALALGIGSAHAAELKGWVRQSEAYPNHQGLKFFFGQVKTASNGKFDGGTVLGADKINSQKAGFEAYKKGELDVAVLSNASLMQAVPEVEVLSLPFMFRDSAHMLQTLDGEIGKGIEKSLAAKGVIVLAWYDGGARNFYTKTKPARFPSDFQGMKVRVAAVNGYVKNMVSALSAEAVPLPYEQVVNALENGTIDGAENDIISYELEGHYKQAKHYFFSNHSVQPEALVVSTQLWAKLSPAERQMFLTAARESAKFERDTWETKRVALKTKLEKEGVKFYELKNSTGFVSRMKSVYDPVLKNQDASSLMFNIMTLRS